MPRRRQALAMNGSRHNLRLDAGNSAHDANDVLHGRFTAPHGAGSSATTPMCLSCVSRLSDAREWLAPRHVALLGALLVRQARLSRLHVQPPRPPRRPPRPAYLMQRATLWYEIIINSHVMSVIPSFGISRPRQSDTAAALLPAASLPAALPAASSLPAAALPRHHPTREHRLPSVRVAVVSNRTESPLT